ncbi:MAG: DUF1311 domain-containing protein [Burkholderiales bacterium]|nr:DUF1311 domain-containing protein [Burkholderiales bacterium]
MKAIVVLLAAWAGVAGAGALDECMIKGDHATVTRCLVDADKDAQAALNKAEGDAARRARELDTATGRPGAAAALAKSMRAFTDYRKAQCDFVRAMYASGAGADQGQLACMIDMTRRRARDFQF